MFVRSIVFCVITCAVPVLAQSLEDENRIAAGYYSREQWDEAIEAFQDLIEHYPTAEQAIVGHFFMGEALLQTDRFADAYPNYQIFLQRLPNHPLAPRATFRMGESAYRLGNYDQAIRLLEIYVRENLGEPLNEFALPYLGEMRSQRLEPQLAQRAFETALRLYPDGQLANKSRLGLAQSLQLQGAFADAIRFYQFIVSQDGNPLAGDAELQLAIIAVNAGDFESARPHLENALALSNAESNQCEASYWLARIFAMEDNYSEAFKLLESVADFKSPKHLASAIYFDGAITAIKLQKREIAIKWLTRLIVEDPDSALADKALHMKIELSRDSPDGEFSAETESLTQLFIQKFPDSPLMPSVIETTGRIHYGKKAYEKSIVVFQELLAADQHVDLSAAASDRTNWFYLLSLNQIGLKRFGAAESSLNQLDISVANEELLPLVQIALATARFGQKKYQYAIPNYRAYLKFVDQQEHPTKFDTIDTEKNNSLQARTELIVCLAESGLWGDVNSEFADLHVRYGNVSLVLETAAYLADKANYEKQPTHAIHWYEWLITSASDPNMIAKALSAVGWLKIESGDAAGGLRSFDRLISEFPDDERVGAAAMARAKAFDDDRDYRKAADTYGLVIRRFGQTEFAPIAKLRRAYALQRLGEPSDLLEAKTLLQEFLALPDDLPARDEAIYQLGWVNFDLKNIDEALGNFRELRTKFPDSKYFADASFRLAQQAVRTGNLSTAQELLSSIHESTDLPDLIEVGVLYLKGEIAAKEQRWEVVGQAMQQLLTQTEDTSLRIKANYWLAESHYQLQRFETAGLVFDRLRDDHEGLDQQLEPWLWLRGGQCLGQQDRWSEALELANVAKTKFPDFKADYEFDFIKGRALEDSGKLNDARVAYQSVIDSATGGATETAAIAQWRIGETYFHQENYADAINSFYNVDSLFTYEKWRSAAMLQAGKCQEHLGNWKQAKKLYTRLIALFPESEYAAAAKERLERVATFAKADQAQETR